MVVRSWLEDTQRKPSSGLRLVEHGKAIGGSISTANYTTVTYVSTAFEVLEQQTNHHRSKEIRTMSNPGGASISAEQLKARYVGTGEWNYFLVSSFWDYLYRLTR
jgi:hypothetical protein